MLQLKFCLKTSETCSYCVSILKCSILFKCCN